MIAKGLASAEATSVLLILAARFDPERHESVWVATTSVGGSFTINTREHKNVHILELEGRYNKPDFDDFEEAGYIRVHRRSPQGVAFRPTQTAREFMKSVEAKGRVVGARPPTDVLWRQPGNVDGTMPIAPGQTLDGRYRIEKELGKGGQGQVFLATDLRFERNVAVKTILSADPEGVARLLREAESVAKLCHPGIVTFLDRGTGPDRAPYLVLEYVPWKTLDEIIKQRRFTPTDALQLMLQVAKALSFAHSQKIVHRDLKPSNIMVSDDGYAKILDFGLAMRLSSGEPGEKTLTQLTVPGGILGTPGYYAPEGLDPGKFGVADARADLFSLGVVFYYVVAGKHPFLRGTVAATMAAVLMESEPALTERSEIEPAGAAIIHQCLKKRPEDRAQTAADLVTSIQQYLEGSGDGKAVGKTSLRPLRGSTLPSKEPPVVELVFVRTEARYDYTAGGVHHYRVGLRSLDDVSYAAFVTIEKTVPGRRDIRPGTELKVSPPTSVSPGDVPTSFAGLFRQREVGGIRDNCEITYKDGSTSRLADDGDFFELHLHVSVNGPNLRVGTSSRLTLYCAFGLNGLFVSEDAAVAKKMSRGALKRAFKIGADALRVAAWLNKKSEFGSEFERFDRDPMLIDLNLAEPDAALAVRELENLVWVTLKKDMASGPAGFSRISPTVALFCETDPHFAGSDPKQDAVQVAEVALGVAGGAVDAYVQVSVLDQTLGWGARRINPAVAYLGLVGAVGLDKSMGSPSPYTTFGIRVSADTRLFVKNGVGSSS